MWEYLTEIELINAREDLEKIKDWMDWFDERNNLTNNKTR